MDWAIRLTPLRIGVLLVLLTLVFVAVFAGVLFAA